MGTFLLLLVICFIVVPLLRVGWYIYRLRRQHKRAWESFNAAARGASGRGKQSQPGRPTSTKKKKIGRDVGEYVEYEDIACNVAQPEETSTRQYHEPQVSDAEWEEIK